MAFVRLLARGASMSEGARRHGSGVERGGRPGIAVLGAVCLATVLLLPAGRAEAQGERIRSFSSDIRIEADGTLLVTERIDYDFGSEHRHGILRDIPERLRYDDRYDRVYPIRVVSVDSPTAPDRYEVEHEGNVYRIRVGDPDREIAGVHRYELRYRVEGALNGFAEHDELYWNTVGHEWQAPIDEVVVRVTAPASITGALCFAGPFGSTLPCDELNVDGSTAAARHGPLDAYAGVTMVIGIPKGVVPAPRPILDERWSFFRAFSLTPVTVALGVLVLLAGLAVVGRLLWIRGRDRRFVGAAVDVAFGPGDGRQQAVPLFEDGAFPVEYAPPEGIRAGQVGTLVDEIANPLDVTATIVDLAVRGYLRIEEIPKKWLFGKPDWRLVRLRGPDGNLLEYERKLLSSLFQSSFLDDEDALVLASAGARGTTASRGSLAAVRLSRLKTTFARDLEEVQSALYRDVVDRGWFAGRPDRVRQSWRKRGVVVVVAGDLLTAAAAYWTTWGIVPIGIVVAGLVLLFGASRMPRRTARGTGMVRRVLGFRRYIDTAEAEEARFAERANLFSEYLPYAIVFGLTERWARAFERLGGQPDTSWYVGHHPFSWHGFSSSIDGFSVTTAGTIASTPAGSGSSGFGGGGFSGGGGGGGGGGSW